MDNDGIHKFGYGHRDLFADLMRLVAPDLAAELDFARAEELPAAYVRPARGRFTLRRHDGMDALLGRLDYSTTDERIGAATAWRTHQRECEERHRHAEEPRQALLGVQGIRK